jgi:hypothetical protein
MADVKKRVRSSSADNKNDVDEYDTRRPMKCSRLSGQVNYVEVRTHGGPFCVHFTRQVAPVIQVLYLWLVYCGTLLRKVFSYAQAVFSVRNGTGCQESGKACTHEVAWPSSVGEERSYLPPSQRAGPPAKQYTFQLDPFQQTAINALESGMPLGPV